MPSDELSGGSAIPPVEASLDPELLRATSARWPGVELDAGVFSHYVKERLPPGGEPFAHPGTPPLEERISFLYLCCACVLGDETACRAFHRTYTGIIRSAIARIDPDPGFVQELAARLFDRLLAGPEPRLERYKGHGNLAAWLKVAATRAALDAKRARARSHFEDEPPVSLAEPAASMSPESVLFCRDYSQDILDALAKATARLLPKQRNLLRMHYADALGIDEIGAIYTVHRATVARWLGRARELLDSTVREVLAKEHGLDSGEVGSLIHGARDALEEALRELLGRPTTDDWEDDEYLAEN